MQVNLHKLKHQVYIAPIDRRNHFVQSDDIGVPQLEQEHYLAVGPLRVGGVSERVEVLLQSLYLAGATLLHLVHMSIRTATNLLEYPVPRKHMRFDLFRHYYEGNIIGSPPND
jgi:hypothetical protein